LTENEKSFDVKVNVYGGGITGQAEAIRLALSRAMCEVDAENRTILKPEGLLTRDPRMVERKKFGQKKARKIYIPNYIGSFKKQELLLQYIY